jgi:hypothetical protein
MLKQRPPPDLQTFLSCTKGKEGFHHQRKELRWGSVDMHDVMSADAQRRFFDSSTQGNSTEKFFVDPIPDIRRKISGKDLKVGKRYHAEPQLSKNERKRLSDRSIGNRSIIKIAYPTSRGIIKSKPGNEQTGTQIEVVHDPYEKKLSNVARTSRSNLALPKFEAGYKPKRFNLTKMMKIFDKSKNCYQV